MNYPVKTCLHCKVQVEQKEGAFELVRKGTTNLESSTGLPISLYSCPRCGYIELYNLRVTGSI